MAPWLQLTASLPSSLILLIINSATYPTSISAQSHWPHNLPRDEKYYPEDEILLKRDIEIQQRMSRCSVNGVRKMSPDPGEKFYLDYWNLGDEMDLQQAARFDDVDGGSNWANLSSWIAFDNPIRVHTGHDRSALFRRMPGWHLFEKRQFQCPSGTSACTSINRPNSCCGTGSTCVIVQDTGLGDVGCCPDGQSCGGSLSGCEEGYSSCLTSPGGGCCIPGYACYDIGCIQTSTATVSPAPGPSTTTVTSYTTITPSISTSSVPSTTTTSTTTSRTSTTTNTSTVAPVIITVTRTVTVTSSPPATLTCASGFRSCPASLGGGCCRTDRECGSAACPASSTATTSATASQPVRPTSEVTTTETTTAPAPSSTSVVGCPTGFYACSAFYQGGCCQIGRDCGSTSCPAGGSVTVVDGDSLTIVAPTGSGITSVNSLLTGNCAQGWATCAPDVGGGCCPSGYACETATCAATAGGAAVGKLAPESSGVAFSAHLGYLGYLASMLGLLFGALGVLL